MLRHSHQGRRGPSIVLVLVVILVAALAGGVGSALAESESPSPGAGATTLRIGWVEDVDNLNPFIGYGSSYEIYSLNYDFLVGFDSEDGSPRPEIAESWETSDDGKVWTFHIREGVTWQDGEPLTAEDVAFTYNFIIENEFSAYITETTLIERAEVVDEYTVRMICSEPKANMLSMYVFLLPEHIWGEVDPETVEVSYKNSPPIVGSGPFQCVEYKKGDFVRMVANEEYWKGAPHVDEIIFEYYTNPDVMVQDLKSGKLDAANGIPAAQFPSVESDPELASVAFSLLTWDYLNFNCYDDDASQGHPALRDVEFRRALSWAVDRQKCADLGWGGYAEPGTTIVTPGDWPEDFPAHYEPTPEETFGFDLEKAGQLLDEAGYGDSDGDGLREYEGEPIELRLWARTDSTASQIQGKLIAGWFKEIGLTVEYSVLDIGALYDGLYATKDGGDTYAPDFDMYLWDWSGYIDPGQTLSFFVTDQIWNWNDPCWSNEEYDRLVEEQYSELDPEKRLAMLHRLQQIFYVEVPEVVIDYPQTLQAVDSVEWEGWVPFMGGALFYSAYNADTYLNVKPRVAVEEESGTPWWPILAGALTAVIVVGVVLRVVRRGRGHAVEE
jgi:peptide/nickel transport system substrate-binding protein